MNIIAERMEAVDAARHLLQEHPMCACLLIDPAEITVVYPEGDWAVPYDGIKHSTKGGAAKAMGILLTRCERDWKGSFPA